MIHHRSRAQVKKFDIFKLITLIVLILLLIPLQLCGSGPGAPVSSGAATGQATQPEEGATTAAEIQATAPATETSAPATQAAATAGGDVATTAPVAEVAALTLDPLTAPLSPGQVELTGTGEPGSTVELVVDGKVVGQTTVGSDGKWKIATELAEPGNYQVGVQTVDASGKVVAASEMITMSVIAPVSAGQEPAAATEEPAATSEVSPEATEEPAATSESPAAATQEPATTSTEVKMTPPTLDLPGGSLTAGQAELTGTGEPGSEVEVVVDGQVVGKTTVGADGKWSLTVELPEAKDYEIAVQAVDASGKTVAGSETAVVAVVTPAPTEEAAGQAAAPTLDVPSGSLTAGEVELTGTGEPNSQVEIVVDGQVVGKAEVDGDGKWSFKTRLPAAGDYKVGVQAVDADGKMLAESEIVLLKVSAESKEATPAPAEPGGQAYIVQADDWLSKLALKFYEDMMAYPVIVDATNAKAKEDASFTTITNPDLIEIGQKLWIPDQAK